jgi:hypothetical protein
MHIVHLEAQSYVRAGMIYHMSIQLNVVTKRKMRQHHNTNIGYNLE